jgi:hypothetical protein
MAFSQPGFNPGGLGLYNQQLGLNLQNYQNISNAYNQAQSNMSSQLGGIYAGYGSLSQSVLNMLGVGKPGDWGVATPAAQQIQRQYEQSQGQNQQSLINAGLGGSTLLANVLNQGSLQAAQAFGSLGSQLAQSAAGYTSQIGLAGLGARMQGLGAQTNAAMQYIGDISHFNFAPNINPWGQYSGSPNYGGYGGHGGGYASAMGPSPALAGAAQTANAAFNPGNAMSYGGGYAVAGDNAPSQMGPQPQSFTGYQDQYTDTDMQQQFMESQLEGGNY